MKIGFIGLGIMGSRMAANLVKHGHELIVYNRTKAKAESLIANKAMWANSPLELASQVEVVFTMVSTPEAVYEVALGSEGFVDHAKENTLWVDCSTVNPSFSRQMAQKAIERQVRFLDAPVGGTVDPAEKGELVFFVGGDTEDVQFCQPLFDIMGRQVIHLGGHGTGTSMKMVFNLLLGEAMFAFSEAMVLGKSLGISQEKLFDTLLNTPAVAPFLAWKREKMEEGEYEAEFPLKWMQKDLQLASVTAYEQRVSLPAVNVIKEIFALAVQHKLADKDFSAIYGFLSEGTKNMEGGTE
jgi:3-hydroxyisobutyrate dehydrogenase/glyoxylate/succinic semialdehyde reductase